MQKEEIVRKTANQYHLPIGLTARVTDALFNQIKEEVANGQKVTFMNFGTFSRAWHVDRKGINPRTKETLLIPAHYVVNFRTGKAFRDSVNQEINNKKE